MVKCLLIIIAVLVFLALVLFMLYKSKKEKLEESERLYEELHNDYVSLENKSFRLQEEMRIEKEQNEKLAKKLADISVMSVDDIMRELQNEG